VAYNGDKDAQKQAADVMAANMEKEGLTLSRVTGLNIGHAYTPDAIVQLDRMMDALAQKGRVEYPREVRFSTWTLKYNRMRWVVVDGLEKHWDRARVNALIESDRIADKLPIQWTADAVVLGTRRFPSATNAPVMIYPNPLNPKRYVVINSGITFREYAEPNNSLQVAYLPDYAVVDLTTPPDARWPGKIAAAGFFGERWELLSNDGQ
jgi:hypothetical protein